MSWARDGTYDRSTEQSAHLAERLVALADTLVDDFDEAELVDQLLADCVDLLDVSAVGVLLSNGAGADDLAAGSDEVSRRVVQVQLEREIGPGPDVVRTGQPVTHADFAEIAARWPAFAAAFVDAGYAAVHTIPMRLHDDSVGALNLFLKSVEQLTEYDRLIARALADAATLGIIHRRKVDHASTLAEQLQRALNTRITIEQAIGVVAEYGGVEMGAAFDAIRSFARGRRAKLSLVAHALTTRKLHPGEVIEGRRHD